MVLVLGGLCLYLSRRRRAELKAVLSCARRLDSSRGQGDALAELDGAAATVLEARRLLSAELANRRAAFDAASGAMLVTDSRGMVTLANTDASALLGRDPLVGRHAEELFTRADLLAWLRSALGGSPADGQVRLARGGAQRIYQVQAQPLGPSGGALLTLRDVTELALASQLKTDFVANASHELRTPLASIRAAMETLADGAWDDAAMRGRLATMTLDNVSRLEQLVADLLDLSRLESPEATVNPQETSVADLASGLRATFDRVLTERRLTLTFEIAPEAATIRTDPTLLQLILRNLIDNAAKFAYEGSTIRVAAQAVAGERPLIRLRVIDRGIGIPIGHQQRVFERFYQVDAARAGVAAKSPRGTGLGLAIVKHAVKALGGAIGVESVWKEGTTMTVELPR